MLNERPSATRNVLSMVLAGFVFGAGCDADEEVTADVRDAVLVGASGHFYADRGELRIDVSPKDEHGNFVGQGLPRSAFSFEEVVMKPLNGLSSEVAVEATVKHVDAWQADPDAALRAVVIFDSSGSMDDNDPDAMGRRLGGTALFDVLSPNDRVAVLDFGPGSTPPYKDSRLLQDFTGDRSLLDAALAKLSEDGGTPLYDSILEGIDLLASVQDDRIPALVVLTDGEADDTLNFELAAETAKAKHIPIYAIGLGKELDFTELSRLTEETGGAFIESSDAVGLERAFAGVSSGIRFGAVTVTGEGMYTLPSGPRRYRVGGNLVTVDAESERIVTPFTFTVDIEESPDDDASQDDEEEDTATGYDSGSNGMTTATWGG